MPGQIKIDDGSGNYTILTNAGSLGSDKTITIPNETATLATTNASNLGGLVKLASATASASSELLFDNFVDEATYSEYIFIIKNLIPQTDNTTLRYVYRSSTPSDITGTYYRSGVYYYGDSALSGFETNLSDTNFGVISDLGNASLETFSGKFSFYYGAGSYSSGIVGKFFRHNPYAGVQGQEYGGFLKASDSIAGIKFYMSSGNITSGSIYIYGVRK